MSAPPSHPEQAPSPPQWESLVTYGIGDLVPLQKRLGSITGEDLQSFVDVRKDGASNDMLTVLYGADLTGWHHEQGRHGDEAADLEYEGGLLYGTRLASTIFYRQTGRQLVADDADAYQVALGVVKRSYEVVSSDVALPWHVENAREEIHTGNNFLSLLNASLDDHITAQMMELYQSRGLGDGIVDEMERVAFYRGLIDSMIFCNSYARFRENGMGPESFEEKVRERTEVWERWRPAITAEFGGDYLPGTYSVETADDLASLVNYIQTGGIFEPTFMTVNARKPDELMLVLTKTLRQSGPNEFHFAYEVVEGLPVGAVSERSPVPYLTVGGALGAVALPAVVALIREKSYWSADALASSPLGVLVGATAAGAVCMMATFVRDFRQIYRRFRPLPSNLLPPKHKD